MTFIYPQIYIEKEKTLCKGSSTNYRIAFILIDTNSTARAKGVIRFNTRFQQNGA